MLTCAVSFFSYICMNDILHIYNKKIKKKAKIILFYHIHKSIYLEKCNNRFFLLCHMPRVVEKNHIHHLPKFCFSLSQYWRKSSKIKGKQSKENFFINKYMYIHANKKVIEENKSTWY